MSADSSITPQFVARLAERAHDAERLRRLPADTIDDLIASGIPRPAGARALQRLSGGVPGHPRSRPPDGARLRVQHVDDRVLRTAQLDAGVVRRAGPAGGLRDATVPRARSPGADRPGCAER